MKKGGFSMVSRSIWRSERFLMLNTHQDRELYFYLLTSPHMNGIGCFRLPCGYALADLPTGWTEAKYHTSQGNLRDAGLIDTDDGTEEVLVEKWMQNNPPQNERHLKSLYNAFGSVESERLRNKLEEEITSFNLAPSGRAGGLLR